MEENEKLQEIKKKAAGVGGTKSGKLKRGVDDGGKGKEEKKGGTPVKVRRILGEKQSNVMEDTENLKAGHKFNEFAATCCEDNENLCKKAAGVGGTKSGKLKRVADDGGTGKEDKKEGTPVKVRRILCEKQSNVMENTEKLNAGHKFNEFAATCCEGKENSGDDEIGSIIVDVGDVPIKKQASQKKRRYRRIWLDVKGFQPWLKLDRRWPHVVYCRSCKKYLQARLSTLKRHACGDDHCKILRRKPPSKKDLEVPLRRNSPQVRKVVKAEIDIVGTLAAVNVPFKVMPTIIKAFQAAEDKPNSVIKEIRVSATRARDLTVNVIGEGQQKTLTRILQNTYFCICVDESTDVSKDNKTLAVVVRYADPDNGHVETMLWDMVPVFQSGREAKASAERLFECIEETFRKKKVPLTNIFACCFDGCNTMTGAITGLKARLGDAIPGIICVRCPAHSTHLCVSKAVDELPREIVTFVSNCYTMLNSSNKLHDYGDLQKLMELPQHKILRQCGTRWLSLEESVIRVIEQYPGLAVFAERLAVKNDTVGQEVFDMMSRIDTKCYMLLLERVLFHLNNLNKCLQRKDVILPLIATQIVKTYKNIVGIILKKDYVKKTKASDIEVFDTEKYLRYVDFEIGDEAREYFLTRNEELETFCKSTYSFIVSISLQIKERFNDFHNEIYDGAECLSPENAVSEEFREEKPEAFVTLVNHYKVLIDSDDTLQLIQTQWTQLITLKAHIRVGLNPQFPRIEDFWYHVFNVKDEKGNYPYAKISCFAMFVLVTPHANADSERIFSDQNYCKNKNRNKMAIATLAGCLRARQVVRSALDKHKVFSCTEEMVDIGADCHYYKNKYAEGTVV